MMKALDLTTTRSLWVLNQLPAISHHGRGL